VTWRRFFALFVLSGFCGLVYQVVWLRLAMAAFGVTRRFVSIVLSCSWLGSRRELRRGELTSASKERPASRFLRLYAATELWIGVSGVAVPPLLSWGAPSWRERERVHRGAPAATTRQSAAWVGSRPSRSVSGWERRSPLGMAAIRRAHPDASSRSFSYLYVANVLGAMRARSDRRSS